MAAAGRAGRPLVMGVLNVTPDSFSDGGLYATPTPPWPTGSTDGGQGADIVDVGGESSRPGAEPVPVDVELARVVPVVEALAARPARRRGVRVSVDTVKPEVATAALAAGASLVNDISASLWEVAAAAGAGWVAMHMQGEPRTMQDDPQLRRRGRRGPRPSCWSGPAGRWRPGCARSGSIPGIGFGKTTAHNLSLLRHLPELVEAAAGRRLRRGPGRAPAASASSGCWPPAPRIGGRPRPWPSGRRARWPRRPQPWWRASGMVRVHDVAATVQMARLYGPAA